MKGSREMKMSLHFWAVFSWIPLEQKGTRLYNKVPNLGLRPTVPTWSHKRTFWTTIKQQLKNQEIILLVFFCFVDFHSAGLVFSYYYSPFLPPEMIDNIINRWWIFVNFHFYSFWIQGPKCILPVLTTSVVMLRSCIKQRLVFCNVLIS